MTSPSWLLRGGLVLAAAGLFGLVTAPASGATPGPASPASSTASSPTINGVGTSVATPAIDAWATALAAAPGSEQISYIGGGISNAEPAFVDNNFAVDGGADFLADEFPLDSSGTQQLASDGQKVSVAPVALSGLSFVVALRMEKCVSHQPSGIPYTQVTSLTLTPDLLAGMFLGQSILNDGAPPQFHYAVANWYDPRILALNPGLSASCTGRTKAVVAGLYSDQIFPIGRQDAVPENQALADFFAQAAPTVWQTYLQLTKNTSYTPGDQFPWDATSLTSNGYLAQDESAQLADLLGGNNASFQTPFYQTVTYLSTGDVAAQQAKFTAAGLAPAFVQLVPNSVTSLPSTGVTPIGPTTSAVAAAGARLTAGTDGWFNADYSFSDATSWPIPLLSSLVVPTNHLAVDSAAPLAALLSFADSATGQQDLAALNWAPPGDTADSYGFSPIDTSLSPLSDAAQAAAKLVAAEATPPHQGGTTTTTTTVPKRATTTTTAPVKPAQSGSGSSSVGGGSTTVGVESTTGAGVVGTRVASNPAPPVAASQPSRGSRVSTAKVVNPVRFVLTGATVPDHPRGTLVGEAFGAGSPWLLALGVILLAAGGRNHRRRRHSPGTSTP